MLIITSKKKLMETIKDLFSEKKVYGYVHTKESIEFEPKLIKKLSKEIIEERFSEAIKDVAFDFNQYSPKYYETEFAEIVDKAWKEALYSEVCERVNELYNKEDFIDTIVERINKKQIKK